MLRHALVWACWVVGIVSTADLRAGNPSPPFSRMPFLQFATPHSIHVVWRTLGPIQPVVRFGEHLHELSEKDSSALVRASLGTNGQPGTVQWEALRTPANLRLPKLHSAPLGTFQYEVKLAPLKPATRYYYAVYDGTERLTPADASYSFTTPPPVGTRTRTRFWVIGDGGTGRQPQIDVYHAMREYLAAKGQTLDLWLHVGDMAYTTGRDMEFQTRFFEPYERLLRETVCWPTMGNHEGATSKGATGIGPYYDAYVLPTRAEAGGLASGTEAYYSFRHANIHFVCLDSHDLDRKPTAAMAKWLKADLEKAKADWVIAFWHHPPYTKGSHDSEKEKDLTEMRQHIMPIIESGGVDLVLTGHSHIYERSMLMDGAYGATTVAENNILDDGDGDPDGDGPYRKSAGIQPNEGTVQVVTGHAGQNLGRVGTLPIFRKTIAEFGSFLVEVDGDSLTGLMLNASGRTRDVFRLVKKGRVQPTRLALPWQPPEYKKPAVEPKIPAVPPIDHQVLVSASTPWRYIADQHPRGLEWTQPGFDVSQWSVGLGGLGYGDVEYRTALTHPRGQPFRLYLRTTFTLTQPDRITELGLQINYRDAFIAYLNGTEVARHGVTRSSGRNAQGIKPREDRGFVYLTLKDPWKYAVAGTNVLAIEAHAAGGESIDFLVDTQLLLED